MAAKDFYAFYFGFKSMLEHFVFYIIGKDIHVTVHFHLNLSLSK